MITLALVIVAAHRRLRTGGYRRGHRHGHDGPRSRPGGTRGERIVALTAADCEILFALGAGDTLVGRGAYCDYPAEVLDIPAVESGYETNIEQIIALEPQLVLMGDDGAERGSRWKCSNRRASPWPCQTRRTSRGCTRPSR